MLNMSGEVLAFINEIDFKSKRDLIDKLRDMRENVNNYEPSKRNTIKQMLGVAIQQVFRCQKEELDKYIQFKKLIERK